MALAQAAGDAWRARGGQGPCRVSTPQLCWTATGSGHTLRPGPGGKGPEQPNQEDAASQPGPRLGRRSVKPSPSFINPPALLSGPSDPQLPFKCLFCTNCFLLNSLTFMCLDSGCFDIDLAQMIMEERGPLPLSLAAAVYLRGGPAFLSAVLAPEANPHRAQRGCTPQVGSGRLWCCPMRPLPSLGCFSLEVADTEVLGCGDGWRWTVVEQWAWVQPAEPARPAHLCAWPVLHPLEERPSFLGLADYYSSLKTPNRRPS